MYEGDPVRAPFYTAKEIREEAAAFSEQFWPSGELPFPIEHILENHEIEIVPCPDLLTVAGVDAFTAPASGQVWIDEFVYCNRPTRTRFSLTHETAHIVLHPGILEAGAVNSVSGWMEFVEAIPPSEHDWLEWQANEFAGLVLVPQVALRDAVGESVDRAVSHGADLAGDMAPAIWDMIASEIAPRFGVSSAVIVRRMRRDRLQEEFS